MKIFISSIITGMESFRNAAREAIEQLGHEAIMAENFGARTHSPQIACLDGVRESGLVVLILGETYGAKQSSGLSATHEEYREAKENRPIIAFVQQDVQPGSDQVGFINEVQEWQGGLFRGVFTMPEKLRAGITRAIHEWQVSSAAGPLNPEQLKQLAIDAVASEQKDNYRSTCLILSVVGGPIQAILRPSEIEKNELAEGLLQAALFGVNKIFTTETGSKKEIAGDSLVIYQEERQRLLKLDPQGSLVFRLKPEESLMGPIILKEELEQQIIKLLHYANWVLDKIDPTQRLSHVAIAAGFTDKNIIIRTRKEYEASPHSFSMGMRRGDNVPVFLKPPHRPRAALIHDVDKLAEDFVTLLKRSSEGQ